MEDEFLLFVIASFVEKFFRISKNNSSFFLFLLSSLFTVFSIFFSLLRSFGEWKKERREILFCIIPPPHFFSLFLAFTPAKKDVSSR